jgi:hypothetical protein
MNLNTRISRLEQTLATQRCRCPDSTDLAWPGNHPAEHCSRCGGERVLYPLTHPPGAAERLLRNALPIMRKAWADSDRADLSKLTDQELRQLREALQAADKTGTQATNR